MELREFAERVLFATTLEGKLQAPAEVTDHHPGPPAATPLEPGRPRALVFKAARGRTGEFPGPRQLESERERGRLLHFFANHELLATELMALALLRFPDAPRAFRRGLLQTLQDEQEHTRLYLQRMQECGVTFGELPVSGYFWRAVSGMANPLDYVARLSLTFEQANLDYARQFAADFSAIGDLPTADLLSRIYRDEIGHVAYGLKWFRQWKTAGLSDWDAFCRQLQFPLSPSRAKGVTLTFNVEGRRAAGLDPEFIQELTLHAQSRGRTPDVFLFNPLAEGRIARGPQFTPVKSQAQLARDLANLPQYLSRRDDVVLVERRPAPAFLSTLREAGLPLPEFMEIPGESGGDTGSSPLSALARRRLGRLRPWAWSPDSAERLAPLLGSVHGPPRRAEECFSPALRRLYSKAWSAQWLRRLLERWSAPWLCRRDEAGVEVNTVEEALAAIEGIRARGHHRVVVKESIGLAGSNALRLWEPRLLDAQRRWLERALTGGRTLVVEPWLERVFDFSIQLEMGPRGLKICGYTGLLNDARGQFQANWAAPQHRRRFPDPVTQWLESSLPAVQPGSLSRAGPIAKPAADAPPSRHAAGRPAGAHPIAAALHTFYSEANGLLEKELDRAAYAGPLNIDAFVYRAPEGNHRLKPVVEINPRYTMGRVAVELMQYACPGTHGVFRLVNLASAQAAGFRDLEQYARSLQDQFPLRLAGEPKPKIHEGILCLNDPAAAEVCLALFQVSPTPPSWALQPSAARTAAPAFLAACPR